MIVQKKFRLNEIRCPERYFWLLHQVMFLYFRLKILQNLTSRFLFDLNKIDNKSHDDHYCDQKTPFLLFFQTKIVGLPMHTLQENPITV